VRALEAELIDEVRAHRARDPLGAILVVVPGRLLAVHLVRRLQAALGGLANVHVLTLPELAERAAGLALACDGRRPLPPVADRLVVREAIRLAVPAGGGYFSAVAGCPNFPDAILGTLLDLRRAGIPADGLQASAPASAKLAELAACYRAVEATLARHGYHDASDLLREAAGRIAGDPAALGAAAVHVHGFLELNPLEARLVEACRTAAPVREHPADRAAATLPRPDAIEIVAAPGEEREVREIARVILRHVAAGGRFDEVGLLVRQPAAYRAAIRDVFEAAGIPYRWAAGPTLGETRAGRTLRLLAEVRRADFARAAVIELLGFADLRPGPGVHPAEWDRLSRQAGIVDGARAWRERLRWLARPAGPEAPDADGDEERAGARARDRVAAAALLRVVLRLARGLGRLRDGTPVAALAHALARTFRGLVRPSPGAERIAAALGRLADLDALEARMDLDGFLALVDAALAAPAEETGGPVPGAVFVGELGQSLGLDFPVVVLPGLVEGGFPPAMREDPVLLDVERRALPGLALAEAARDLERLRFRLACGSGARRLVLSYPRVDAVTGRPRVPSFLLLELLEEVTGEPHDFAALERFPGWRAVPLLPAPPAAREWPIDEREWLVTRALDARAWPEALLRGLPAARRGAAAIAAREREPRLTAYDGLLARGIDAAGEVLAPTWLERYAACPFRFLAGRVLGARPVEEPDRILTLEAAERGSLVHAVLQTTFRRLGEAGALPLRPEGLGRALEVLEAALAEHGADAERRGVTGLPALWAVERRRLAAELQAALHAEARDPEDWTPALLEAAFGEGVADADAPAVTYALPDGTRLRLRGRVDRIDLSPDGRRARVVDYKTGRVTGPRTADRLAQGRALQLPVYRLAAEALLGRRGHQAEIEDAQYYHVVGHDAGTRVRFTRAGWDGRRPDFDRVLVTIVEGLRAGRFFARPAACGGGRPCEYDLACGAERRRWAEAKAADPAVAGHARLEAIE
jgi:RecB family exonuclease